MYTLQLSTYILLDLRLLNRQKLLAGKENSQIFNEDFYLPLYLPLWYSRIKLIHKFLLDENKGENKNFKKMGFK
jgi:hypothetical protein